MDESRRSSVGGEHRRLGLRGLPRRRERQPRVRPAAVQSRPGRCSPPASTTWAARRRTASTRRAPSPPPTIGSTTSNTVTDGFAVVDTNGVGGMCRGALREPRRRQGVSSGRLLVPDVRAWDVNRLESIRPDVPIDAQVPYTERLVRPPDRSGVVVGFPIRRTSSALIVPVVRDLAIPLPVGSTATLEATGVVRAGRLRRASLRRGLSPSRTGSSCNCQTTAGASSVSPTRRSPARFRRSDR